MAQDDIQGQVVDAQGNPVSGAIVELTKSYQSSPLDEQVVRRTTTDSNGNYIFDYHPDGDGTTQEWHVSCYNYDGTAYVNSNNNPGVTADLPSSAIPDSVVAHYDATQLDLNDGEQVDEWPDEHGDFDLTDRNNDPRFRESGINGDPSVEYGQTVNDRNGYDGDPINLDPPYSLVWAAEVTGTRGSDDISFFAEDRNDDYNLRINDGNDDGFNPRLDAADQGSPFSHNAVQEYLMVFVHDDNGNDFVRMNGTQESYSFPNVGVPDDYGIGGEGASDRGMEGYIGEFLLFDSALSSNEIESEEERLSDKWGISLD